jgi:hypothetical protein
MKANSALGLVCAGAALWLLAPAEQGLRRWLGRALAAIVLLIGVLTLAEHLVGFDLGIDSCCTGSLQASSSRSARVAWACQPRSASC